MSDDATTRPFPPPDSPLHAELAAVLDARSDDDPSREQLARLSSRLAAVLPPGALPTPPGSVHPPAVATGAAGGTLAKIGLGLALVAAASGGWLALHGSTPTTGTQPVAVPSPVSSSSPTEEPPIVRPAPITPPATVPSERAIAPSRPGTAPAPQPDVPTRSEADILTEAHEAMLGGKPERALALAADHARGYPNGTLAQEGKVIAIESLVALGRTEEARLRAAAFRATYPRSSHLARIDQLVGGR